MLPYRAHQRPGSPGKAAKSAVYWTDQREVAMALKGVLRPGYIQIRVTDLNAALTHYIDRIGLHEVSREADGRVYLRAWDEFDRHSIVLRQADMPGMDYAGFKVASDSD